LRPLRERLEDLVVEMAQATSSSFSQEFRQEVDKVCDDIEQSSPTSRESTTREEYEKYLISEYKNNGGWSRAVEEQLNILRADLTSKIGGRLDKYLREKTDNILKDVLNRVFPESLKNLLPSMNEETPNSQVLSLRDMMDKEKSPNLYAAFDYVAKFDFSYHSHFHHRVRKEMGRLSSYNIATVDEIIPRDADATNVREKSSVIADGLDNAYKGTLFQVRAKLIEMDEDPGYSIFTLVEDFKDRVIRTKDIEDEWDEFLYPLRAQIWAEKYKAQEEILTLYNGWKDAIDKTLRLARQVKADFAV